MIIPFHMLEEKTLRAVIEEFVTRDGSEFTDREEKIAAVDKLLCTGKAQIVYDPESQSCSIKGVDN